MSTKKEFYENMKKILNVYHNRSVNREELKNYDNDLTENKIGTIITLLNNIDILKSERFEKGNNRLKDDLYNKNIFNSKDFNIALLASLAYTEDENAKEIMKYIFKTTIQNMTFSIANRYSKNFPKNIIELLDKEKYSNFASIIKENNANSRKIICKILVIETQETEEIIPLEFFIFNDSWYICAYFLDNNKLDIIDSKNIEYVINQKTRIKNSIPYFDIEKCIRNYIIKENKKDELFVILRLNPETLSLLIEFGLILEKEYEIFEDNMRNDNKLFLLGKHISEQKKLSEINLNQTYLESNIDEETVFDKKISFYEDDSKKYIIKTKLSKQILGLILNLFSTVEELKYKEG
jgi:hypothetical protein